MRKGSFNHDPVAQAHARAMRDEMTVGEEIFWSFVRRDQLGFRFRRQFRIGPYILDFYCARAKLCVEIDGEQHARNTAYDVKRDAFLEEAGIETLRIPSLDICSSEALVRERWIRAVERRGRERAGISHPQPPPSETSHSEGWGSEVLRA